jgi:hypothetical protein
MGGRSERIGVVLDADELAVLAERHEEQVESAAPTRQLRTGSAG